MADLPSPSRPVHRHRPRSGGPRTAAGRRRSALNRAQRGLCPGWVRQDLARRGEDPREFIRLHRDLRGWLGPEDARTRVVVESLAEAWWEKVRRRRDWVGTGPPDTREIDAHIDDLLQRFVWGMGYRNRKWRYRLTEAFGPVPGPKHLRLQIEARVPALGDTLPAQDRQRRYRRDMLRELDEATQGLLEMLRTVRMLKAERANRGKPADSSL
jgi:hypothetical protein